MALTHCFKLKVFLLHISDGARADRDLAVNMQVSYSYKPAIGCQACQACQAQPYNIIVLCPAPNYTAG